MARIPKTLLRVLLVAAAGGLSVASTQWPELENDRRTDETWLVMNLWDGQTAVDPDQAILLAVGEQDVQFSSEAPAVLAGVQLLRLPHEQPVQIQLDIGWAQTEVVVVGGLTPDTDYLLDLGALEGNLYSRRGLPPGPIWFSTRSAPRVVGLYRSGGALESSTLLVMFSEPMDADSLFLSQQSVDVVWSEGGALQSVAADHNLAAYAWDTSGHLFLLAPFDFAHSVWLKISRDVQGMSGAGLDGNHDGVGGTASDDWVGEISAPWELPICYARVDIPQPCIEQHLIPEFGDIWM